MFDDLIKKIKSKLPEKFRGEDDFEEEYEEDEEGIEEDKTVDIDVDEVMDNDEDEDDDDDFDEDEEEKKAKRSKLIKIVCAVAIVGLGADMLLTEEKPVAPVVKKRKKRKKDRKKIKKSIAKKEGADTSKNTIADKKIENPKIKKEASNPVVKPEQKKPEVIATVAPKLEEKKEPVPTIANIEPQKTVTPTTTVEKKEVKIGEAVKPTATPVAKEKPALTLEQMAAAIEPDKLEYSAPPSYDDFGRGLVYNCKGKHWACVGKNAYLGCEKNEAWSKENKKSYECKTSNIYATDKDCRIMQIHNINTIKDTTFCN
jgi:hypothetical protein